MRQIENWLFTSICLTLLMAIFNFFGCASIQHPTGGPRDSIPPKILQESPKNLTTNFNSEEITIEFDEYFKLTNEFKEISVSPAMERNPNFKVRKRALNIEFQEPLQANTTYTINFGNAITDINEGNVLKNYVYVFSTGSKIDSLSISGRVINTLTKEPVLDATVFLLPIKQDTLFGKKRASLFTATDSSGNYKLNYLREDRYRIYALKEQSGGDRIYNSTNELIGFRSDSLVLTKDTTKIDLEVFQEDAKQFRVIDRKIEKDARITYIFNQQLSNPRLIVLDPAGLNQNKIVEIKPTRDTAYLWTNSMEFDSINVAVYDAQKPLDTLLIRKSRRDTYDRTMSIGGNIASGRLRPGTDVRLLFSAPIGAIDGKKFALLQDSVPVTGLRIARDSSSSRTLILKFPWKEEKNYILTIAENGVTGLFAGGNKAYSQKFVRDMEDNYGTLTAAVTVPDASKSYIVQLLEDANKVIEYSVINKNTTVNFPMLAIGKYTLRIIYDDNKNGKWDTGDVSQRLQPERVWNLPSEISLRANFDQEEKVVIPKPQ
jgi:hypothetical protein